MYLSIDLKSFYASVECIKRGLNPSNTNLVVADIDRTEKTICLAVSPALKSFGVPSRLRLFELTQIVKKINYERKKLFPSEHEKSIFLNELMSNRGLEIDYIIAKPQMKTYIRYSSQVYKVYLKYFDPKDIFVYSIDEVFIDIKPYLDRYKCSAKELTTEVLKDVFKSTQITATAGIGTNLYLAKVAMDILAKRQKADSNGVIIAFLDEKSYRKILWGHRKLTDFWRIGEGYAVALRKIGIHTMGELARFAIKNEQKLYNIFGVNAELLIDHAFGYEPCTMKDIQNYKPMNSSKCIGKVLPEPYDYKRAKSVLISILDLLVLEIIKENLLTSQIVLDVRYDKENLEKFPKYKGATKENSYGVLIPKNAHGTKNIHFHTNSIKTISELCLELFDEIINKNFTVRKISISLNFLMYPSETLKTKAEIDLFTDFEAENQNQIKLKREERLQKARLAITDKYGNNKLFKASALIEEKLNLNNSVGGHNG